MRVQAPAVSRLMVTKESPEIVEATETIPALLVEQLNCTPALFCALQLTDGAAVLLAVILQPRYSIVLAEFRTAPIDPFTRRPLP